METTKVKDFHVIRRNHGHWDIIADKGRAFRIRGGPGRYLAMDERAKPYPVTPFKTIGTCMQYICDEMMFEIIVVNGQEPTTIESWNI
jgi:hypothetical protein